MGLLAGSDNDKKPLFRTWAKGQKDARSTVESIRLSSSEEWILIECEDCVCLLNAESKVGQAFWKTVQQFNGKARGLVAFAAKGKIGFDLEPSEVSGIWSWIDASEVEFSSGRKSSKAPTMSSDLWKKMIDDSWQKEAEKNKNKERAGKTSVKDTENSSEALGETTTPEEQKSAL